MDAMSGLWCVNIGYGRKELADAAANQLNELPYYNSFFQCANPPSIELAKTLKQVTQSQIFAGYSNLHYKPDDVLRYEVGRKSVVLGN